MGCYFVPSIAISVGWYGGLYIGISVGRYGGLYISIIMAVMEDSAILM
jgi:hypothetical protein